MLEEMAAMNNAVCNEAPCVSVVVPVYNAAAQLDDTLYMLRNQTFAEFELILVNDGSNDSSGEIIEKHCSEDRRLRCLSQANAGAGPARNLGMASAVGKYLIFLDADDSYSPFLLEELVAETTFNELALQQVTNSCLSILLDNLSCIIKIMDTFTVIDNCFVPTMGNIHPISDAVGD